MINTDIIFNCGMLGLFLSMILYVLFGQLTVRKLRKNPATKESLGLEFANGWDVFNVAQALALPESITKKLSQSPISFLFAKTELLIRSTNKFDKIIASIFYWVFTISILSLLSLAVLQFSSEEI